MVRRLTFSQDLALFIQSKNPDHEIWKLDLVVGQEASPTSTGCIFGILDLRKGRLLRAAVSFQEAAYLSQDPSRMATECRVRAAERWRPPLSV